MSPHASHPSDPGAQEPRHQSPREGLGRALGKIPSGLFIVTAGRGAEATGFLASWVQQSGFEPPTVTVAIKKERPVLGVIQQAGAFAISLVSEAQMKLVRHFAKGFPPGVPAFEGLATANGPTGTPHLSAAMGWLDCRLTGQVDTGDHLLVVGTVLAGDAEVELKPFVHVRKSGFGY
jgi:flavin reductase (DIM6/NTAB) family NADH-FMN oxidoreductase RutF